MESAEPAQLHVDAMGSTKSLSDTTFISFHPFHRAGVMALPILAPTIDRSNLLVITLPDTGSVDNAFDSYHTRRGLGKSDVDRHTTSAGDWETASDKLIESLLR
jgi:hypothetical protein